MQLPHPTDYQVVELRRYLIRDGECAHFAAHFDSYFPEAFEQLGAIAFGQFLERGSERFTWLRGFRDMDARAVVNAAFYYGPVWKQHKAALNGLMLDSDDVLLLHPLRDGDGVAVLPTVDAVAEAGRAHGVAVVQLFALEGDAVEAFAEHARPMFDAYRASGARPAGLLATLDAPNNFPQLPVRTDGHWLAWIGLVDDEAMLERLATVQQHALPALMAGGLLRAPPEVLVLDPTRRSRLRWLSTPPAGTAP